MPIAKEVLRVGFTVAAVPGGYVTKEAVKQYGWQDLVDDGPDVAPVNDDDDQASKAQRKAQNAK